MKTIRINPTFLPIDIILQFDAFDLDIHEVYAMAIEAYRQPHPYQFYEQTLLVVLGTDPMNLFNEDQADFNLQMRGLIRQSWNRLHPWLSHAYRIYPNLYQETVHTVTIQPFGVDLSTI